MTDLLFRPRRSCLYMPGSNARALEKAKTLPADMVIFDLEDAVAPDAKADARMQASDAVKAGGFGKRETIIRINALSSEWGSDDLKAAVAAGPNGILAPKIENANDVLVLDKALGEAGAGNDFGLWIMIEMPRAILNINEIAATAEATRLSGFVLGTNDLAKEMRAVATPDRTAFQSALSVSVTAARAYGITAIDGVYNDIGNDEGLAKECEQGRILGYDGKTLIHPSQLETANRIFAPKAEELEEAKAIIAAFDLPENAGKGVIKVNGKMTELLHLEEARRITAMQAAINQLS